MLGGGIIKGLATTARNFLGSYVEPDRLTTVQYPEEQIPAAENARSFPFLVYDGDDPVRGLRCVACKICEVECPPQCIFIIKDQARKPDHLGKLQNQPRIFDIDLSVCMSCQICVEVCPFDAIKMDTAFELSASDRFEELMLHKEQLSKPNTYYQRIHPTEAATVDASFAAAKARAKSKAEADLKGKAVPAVVSQPPAAPMTGSPPRT